MQKYPTLIKLSLISLSQETTTDYVGGYDCSILVTAIQRWEGYLKEEDKKKEQGESL